MSIYLRLTQLFNAGRKRAVICSGQAGVMHRIAIMSKDGDWIIREDDEAINHILKVLNEYGAVYRFGAPLAVPWLAAGWSSHFEFILDGMRIRTDFFSRPPRFTKKMINTLWKRAENEKIPVVGLIELAEQKKTMREKDYAVIGAIAERLKDSEHMLLYSRDALEILKMTKTKKSVFMRMTKKRACLKLASKGREALENALDKERREFMRADEMRLAKFAEAAAKWQAAWPKIIRKTESLSLLRTHKILVDSAFDLLPTKLEV